MSITRTFLTSIASLALAAPALPAEDLARYRGFQLGASLAAVAQQARINAEPRILQTRPGLIEELMWQPPAMRSPSPEGESVKKILFTFYDGQLFRMVVSYERDRTEGLTAEDMIASVSEMYGLSRLRAAPIGSPTATSSEGDSPAVDTSMSTILGFDATSLAHWADADHSVSLFRTPYQATFGLVISSSRLEARALAAAVEAARLDAQEAPQREADRLRQREDDQRINDAKARESNRAIFRP